MKEYRNITKFVGPNRVYYQGEMRYRKGSGSWVLFSGDEELMKIGEYKTNTKIWKLQDGYGSPGFTPVQGWDWSGIRDSSDEAIVKMLAVAEKLHGNKPWSWEKAVIKEQKTLAGVPV